MSNQKKTAEDFYKLGNELYEAGDFEQAIFYYDGAIKLDPTWVNPHYNKSLSLACIENYSAALQEIQLVLELKPDYAEAYYIMGLAQEYSKKYDEAEKAYLKAIDLNPGYNDAKNRLEALEKEKSKPKTRISSSSDDKISSADLMNEINELIKNGQYNEALTVVKNGLTKQPDNIHLLLHKTILEAKIEAATKRFVVIGLKELKEAVDRLIIYPLKFADHPLYQATIAKTSKGFLIFGPPGCGKTHFIKSLATKAGITLIEVVLSDVLSMWCGESEKRLTEVFAKAKETAKSGTPILLFIDEVDALGYARTMTPEPNDASSNRHLIATFLKLLDGIQDIPNIVVVGATNRLWSVDEALRRPGRLGSAILYVPPPDEHARKELFKHYSWETPGHTNLKFKELARQTPWFSGDDIRNICRDVHFKLAQNNIKYKKNRHAEMRDFIKLIKNKKLQLQTINWMRQVTRYYDEGKIDSKEIDRKLLEDIERFRKNEFSPDRDTREDHDPSFI